MTNTTTKKKNVLLSTGAIFVFLFLFYLVFGKSNR